MRPSSLNLSSRAAVRPSRSVFAGAPLGGWNAEDSPGVMPKTDAIDLMNFFPGENGLVTRGGSLPWCTGLGSEPVETIMDWNGSALFAVAGGTVYALPEASDYTTEAAATTVTGLANSRLQWALTGSAGGNFLWCCNGADTPFYYNGTAWATATLTVSGGGAFTGVVTNVCTHQNRLFLTASGSLTLHYLGTQAVQGEVKSLPLAAYFSRGGELIALGGLTADGGAGPDDMLAVLSSEGEAILFSGTNPDSADTWTMVGNFTLARPLGRRCLAKYGVDLLVLTERGLAGLNPMLGNEMAGLKSGATDKIRTAWAAQVAGYGAAFGWEVRVYHRKGLIVVNVPDGMGFLQWVCNPATGAWGRLSGWYGSSCLHECGGRLFGGDTGFVRELDVFFADVSVTGSGAAAVATATPIEARVQHAFLFPGGQGAKKRFTLMRPYLVSAEQPQAAMGIGVDGATLISHMPVILRPVAGDVSSEWYAGEFDPDGDAEDAALWAVAGTSPQLRTRWVNCVGVGYSVSVAVSVTAETQNVTYLGCDIQYVPGMML